MTTKTPAMVEDYKTIERAFNHFNAELFGNKLPPCVFTLNRTKRAKGFFWKGMWTDGNGEKRSEISLNPELFAKRTVKETLSTLCHEMVHLQQDCFGKPGKGGYHNAEFRNLMEDIGLITTSTGKPGGKRTGRNITHLIVDDGKFSRSCDRLIAQGIDLLWKARETSAEEIAVAKKKRESKSKFTCPSCGSNAWGKPDLLLVCGHCTAEKREPVIMLRELRV